MLWSLRVYGFCYAILLPVLHFALGSEPGTESYYGHAVLLSGFFIFLLSLFLFTPRWKRCILLLVPNIRAQLALYESQHQQATATLNEARQAFTDYKTPFLKAVGLGAANLAAGAAGMLAASIFRPSPDLGPTLGPIMGVVSTVSDMDKLIKAYANGDVPFPDSNKVALAKKAEAAQEECWTIARLWMKANRQLQSLTRHEKDPYLALKLHAGAGLAILLTAAIVMVVRQ